LLYYLTYKRSGYDVVSAVLIMSNSNVLYRATLTDYKVGFDTNLEKLFPVMASIKVVGEHMPRVQAWEAFVPAIAIGATLLSLLAAAVIVRNRRMKKLMGSFSKGGSNVEDLENEMLGKSTGRTGKRKSTKSRPPASAASNDKFAMSIAPMSEAAQSVAAQSVAAHSVAAQSVAAQSVVANSVVSHNETAKSGAALPDAEPSAAALSMADVGGKIASVVPRHKDDAPESLAFNMNEVPESQPLSVAFAGESKPAKQAEFKGEGQIGSHPPKSDSPLPVGKKKNSSQPKPAKKEAEMSGFDKSMFGTED
jgi:hypothetical protein